MEEIKPKRCENQKVKILFVLKILLEHTDKDHGIEMKELLRQLGRYGIKAERKSVGDDIEALQNISKYTGIEISEVREKRSYFYMVTKRSFNVPELKLLIDAVRSSKFVSEKMTEQLVAKIKALVSKHERDDLRRELYSGIKNRKDDKLLKAVDLLNRAILENSKIRCKYINLDFKKNEVKKIYNTETGSEIYILSPWQLVYTDDNYYLVAYEDRQEKKKPDERRITHYRVDKMRDIRLINEERIGEDKFEEAKVQDYSSKMFSMFSGQDMTVHIECDKSMAGVMIDRFGIDVPIIEKSDNLIEVIVKVSASNMFYGWIASLGPKVRITGPQEAVDEMKKMAETLSEQYR